ncbi:G-patch domain-containing protein [Thalictrum thalictroides]|uniref:G-patch domain-containing protein n=1 Tax=Thalictrum thalictroides TaxID=46969 RepID=A0A7J6V001_THATH|nr:G-patch domain-containing protein [Thalictrum thalictroides]
MAGEPQDEEDDYMADLSRFLPPEETSRLLNIKNPNFETLAHQSSNKKLKTLNWQQQRKIDRERNQREEDEKTLVNMESVIPQSNIGFKMLKQMGYKPGSALGKDGSGLAQPVGLDIRRSRAGVGREDPVKEKIRIDLAKADKLKKQEHILMLEFGTRKKSEWRIRRVIRPFRSVIQTLQQPNWIPVTLLVTLVPNSKMLPGTFQLPLDDHPAEQATCESLSVAIVELCRNLTYFKCKFNGFHKQDESAGLRVSTAL